MGDFSEHVLFGLLVIIGVFLIADLTLDSTVSVLSILLVFIGSVLPDIDHENSYVFRAARSITSLSAGGIVFVLYTGPFYVAYGISALTVACVFYLSDDIKLRHRGLTHSWRFCISIASTAVIASILAMRTPFPGLALGAGIASHLLLDGEFKF